MIFKIARRNIWRNKRRSLITIASITFAVLLACVMRSMQLGSYERMIENTARFYTGYIQFGSSLQFFNRMRNVYPISDNPAGAILTLPVERLCQMNYRMQPRKSYLQKTVVHICVREH